nr:hypothetical protein Iba_chr03cCG3680 [Ipomoea batatas]
MRIRRVSTEPPTPLPTTAGTGERSRCSASMTFNIRRWETRGACPSESSVGCYYVARENEGRREDRCRPFTTAGESASTDKREGGRGYRTCAGEGRC